MIKKTVCNSTVYLRVKIIIFEVYETGEVLLKFTCKLLVSA